MRPLAACAVPRRRRCCSAGAPGGAGAGAGGARTPAGSGRRSSPRGSRGASGRPNRGRLRRRRAVPGRARRSAFTWDFPLGVSPSRPVAALGHGEARPHARVRADASPSSRDPLVRRVGVADLSRPQGGPFGRAVRRARARLAPERPRRRRALPAPRRLRVRAAGASPTSTSARSQRLVSAFVAAGARYVFVSPALWRRGRLRGPARDRPPARSTTTTTCTCGCGRSARHRVGERRADGVPQRAVQRDVLGAVGARRG